MGKGIKKMDESNKLVKYVVFLSALFLFICICPIGSATAEVKISPPDQNVYLNDEDEFYVNIVVDTTEDILGLQFKLSFNNSVLEALSVEKGPFLSGTILEPPGNTINNTIGEIIWAYSLIPKKSGTGVAVKIKFKAKSSGTSTLDLQGTTQIQEILINGTGHPMTGVTITDGNVTVHCTVTCSIPLNIGWNLVSIPIHPGDTSVAEVLSSLGDPANVGPGTWDGDYTKVQAYIDGEWKSFIPTVPGGGDLKNINETMGFWINMKQDTTLVVEGYPNQTQRDIPLKVGWNMIDYASTKQTQPVADALSSLGDPANVGPGTWDGNYTKVQAYIDGEWKSFIPTVPGGGALKNMTQGCGYWINMTQDDVLRYDWF